MDISHVGHTTIPTLNHDIHLKNVLNLVSVHRLAADSFAFLEFHLDFFCTKDQARKNTLLKKRCQKGLYPLPPAHTVKQLCGASILPMSKWHSRLGHPSSFLVKQVVSRNNLLCLDKSIDQ
jgi:hypothetical protein